MFHKKQSRIDFSNILSIETPKIIIKMNEINRNSDQLHKLGQAN